MKDELRISGLTGLPYASHIGNSPNTRVSRDRGNSADGSLVEPGTLDQLLRSGHSVEPAHDATDLSFYSAILDFPEVEPTAQHEYQLRVNNFNPCSLEHSPIILNPNPELGSPSIIILDPFKTDQSLFDKPLRKLGKYKLYRDNLLDIRYPGGIEFFTRNFLSGENVKNIPQYATKEAFKLEAEEPARPSVEIQLFDDEGRFNYHAYGALMLMALYDESDTSETWEPCDYYRNAGESTVREMFKNYLEANHSVTVQQYMSPISNLRALYLSRNRAIVNKLVGRSSSDRFDQQLDSRFTLLQGMLTAKLLGRLIPIEPGHPAHTLRRNLYAAEGYNAYRLEQLRSQMELEDPDGIRVVEDYLAELMT